MERLQAAAGVIAFVAVAAALSEDRRAIDWRRAGIALAVTAALLALLLTLPGTQAVLAMLNRAASAVDAATRAGTSFVFGYLGGGPLPFEPSYPGGGFILAFQALPLIIVVSVLSSLLFHWRILPAIVRGFGWLFARTLGVGGAVGVSTAANIFVGMVEAPLFIRPYLLRLSRSELFVVMTGGMAGIAGTVMVLYATIIGPSIPGAFGHILIASVAGAPAAILIGRLLVPDPRGLATAGGLDIEGVRAGSSMDAVAQGAMAGVALVINVVAMLIALIALVHLANLILGLLPELGGAPVSLERLLGLAMAPVCWLMGIPWGEAVAAGRLMGLKTVLNEFIAYLEMAKLPPEALSARSRLIMLYALCGFANLGSVGIMIGGMAAMCAERRVEIAGLGLKSLVAGTLCTCLLGALVAIVA
ncbi:MAG: nucleoside:proton symporter [Alphaproteobacteria bacterium]|nr:nucleoside:proton symporter [Alphaproteobacteria bacterium]